MMVEKCILKDRYVAERLVNNQKDAQLGMAEDDSNTKTFIILKDLDALCPLRENDALGSIASSENATVMHICSGWDQ